MKLLHQALAQNAEVRSRFRRELFAVGKIHHPNVVAGIDASTTGEHCYLVTDYLEGASLRDAFGGVPLPTGVACEIARQIGRGLAAIAEQELVHRDLSPSNVFVTADGGVKLLDFGLVRLLSPGLKPENWLTEPGVSLGNPAYMAPEQQQFSSLADIRSDLYSLGCILYQMLAGHVPFGDTGSLRREQFPAKHAQELPTPLATLRPDLDPALVDLVTSLLEKQPDDRPQTPAAVVAAIQPFADESGLQAFARTLATPVHSAGEPTTLVPDLRRHRSRRWLLLLLPISLALVVSVASVVPPSSTPTNTPKNPAPQPDPAELTNSIGLRLRRIPAGEFVMGSPPEEWARMDRGGVETQRRVVVPRPAYAGVYEVTQGEYRTVTSTNPSHFAPTGPGAAPVAAFAPDRLPADSVSWFDATEFCRKLSARPEERAAGRVYRLPSEEEWEYACRAGTTTPFHFGDSLSSLQANIHPDPIYPGVQKLGPARGHPLPVGSFPANAFGLHDMHGNVMEWTATAVPNAPERRVIRGGHWLLAARDSRSATRANHADEGGIAQGADAGAAGQQYGFRVWCDVKARE